MSGSIAAVLLPDFDREMTRTRTLLAAVPADKLDWAAADELRTIGWNANHIADLIGWTQPVILSSEFDMAPPDGPKYETPTLSDPAEILAAFDRHVAAARQAIAGASDDTFHEPWTLKSGGEALFTISKLECLQTWVLHHTVHHRGILSVYLRMAGVEVTPVYDG